MNAPLSTRLVALVRSQSSTSHPSIGAPALGRPWSPRGSSSRMNEAGLFSRLAPRRLQDGSERWTSIFAADFDRGATPFPDLGDSWPRHAADGRREEERLRTASGVRPPRLMREFGDKRGLRLHPW